MNLVAERDERPADSETCAACTSVNIHGTFRGEQYCQHHYEERVAREARW